MYVWMQESTKASRTWLTWWTLPSIAALCFRKS